jgi:transposase
MTEIETFEKLLDIRKPWFVSDIDIDQKKLIVTLTVDIDTSVCKCPHCGKKAKVYDKRHRTWRHLDTMEFKTLIAADVPRVQCLEHGIVQVEVPWAESLSRYSVKFETLIIDWLQETSVSAVARNFDLSWNAVDGIMKRAVERGLDRRKVKAPKNISVDETAFQRRHEYVTVVTDQSNGEVLYIADDRKKESLEEYYKSIGNEALKGIESVSMDMWPAYITVTKAYVPDAENKICFDKFHCAQYLGNAVDKVRREENKELIKNGNDILTGSRYLWLRNPEKMDKMAVKAFKTIRDCSLKTASAWAVKEHAMCLWHYDSRTWAKKQWMNWYNWAMETALTPVQQAATTIINNLWGIINAIVRDKTNAHAESMNSRIQSIKAKARGFRNRARFKMVVYFHCGKLNLYPQI